VRRSPRRDTPCGRWQSGNFTVPTSRRRKSGQRTADEKDKKKSHRHQRSEDESFTDKKVLKEEVGIIIFCFFDPVNILRMIEKIIYTV